MSHGFTTHFSELRVQRIMHWLATSVSVRKLPQKSQYMADHCLNEAITDRYLNSKAARVRK